MSFVLFVVVGTFPAFAANVVVGSTVRSLNGVVSAANELAAIVGAEILAKGGNAVDAAVAVAYALTAVEPQASHLGGEGYLVLSLADGTETAIDFRSRAPLHVNAHTRYETGYPLYGTATTMIPGMVKGTEKALQLYGTMTLAEVLQPAIRLAEKGFPVSERLIRDIADAYDSMLVFPELGTLFLVDALIPEPGTMLTNPDLGCTLRLLAEYGSEVFYRGEIADAIKKSTNGWLDKASLAAYEAYEREPVRGKYRGYDIIAAPPVGAGIVLIEALNILETFDLSSFDSLTDPYVVHLIAETFKLAMADYFEYVWDPNFYDVPVAELTAKQYARLRAQRIALDEARVPVPGDPHLSAAEAKLPRREPDPESLSTTHISVVDRDGNAVSLTQTLSSTWGSRVLVPGYGFLLNNHFRLFLPFDAQQPQSRGYAEPLKTSRTVLTPVIVKKDGNVRLVAGTPGSYRIPSTMLQTIVGYIDFGMDIESAVAAPKVYATGLQLDLERGFPEEALKTLLTFGHRIYLRSEFESYFGGPNVVAVDEDGTMIGLGSQRRKGSAAAPASIKIMDLKP